jgi:hypothetical protein
LTVSILAKGRCFLDLQLKSFVHVAVSIRYRKQINTARGYCWGPSSSEGPQKRNLTMSSKHGLWTGTFGLRLKHTRREEHDRDEGCRCSEAMRKGASPQLQKKEPT